MLVAEYLRRAILFTRRPPPKTPDAHAAVFVHMRYMLFVQR